jgi:hypothetical protein
MGLHRYCTNWWCLDLCLSLFSSHLGPKSSGDWASLLWAYCWRSLTSTLYLQLMHNIIVKGLLVHSCRVYSDKFHELCCSHPFCRIIDISPHKSITNDKTEHTIVKISSRRSKRTYHLLYLESRRESPRWIRLGILWNTLEPSLSKSFMD